MLLDKLKTVGDASPRRARLPGGEQCGGHGAALIPGEYHARRPLLRVLVCSKVAIVPVAVDCCSTLRSRFSPTRHFKVKCPQATPKCPPSQPPR